MVKCAPTDFFEADTNSFFDNPDSPHRIPCSEKLSFNYSRPTFAEVKEVTPAEGNPFIAPRVYSELAVRSASAGAGTAAIVYSNAAIASTAKILGDANLDQYVGRDPLQNYRLVFNMEGVKALKDKQKLNGLPESGILDSATQSAIARESIILATQPSFQTPEIKCSRSNGPLFCSSDINAMKGVSAINVPSFEIKGLK